MADKESRRGSNQPWSQAWENELTTTFSEYVYFHTDPDVGANVLEGEITVKELATELEGQTQLGQEILIMCHKIDDDEGRGTSAKVLQYKSDMYIEFQAKDGIVRKRPIRELIYFDNNSDLDTQFVP